MPAADRKNPEDELIFLTAQSKVSPFGRNDNQQVFDRRFPVLSFPEVHRDKCSTSALRGETFTTVKQGFSLRSKRQSAGVRQALSCIVVSTSALRGETFTTIKQGFSLWSKRQTVCVRRVLLYCRFDECPSRRNLHHHQGFSLRSKRQTVCVR